MLVAALIAWIARNVDRLAGQRCGGPRNDRGSRAVELAAPVPERLTAECGVWLRPDWARQPDQGNVCQRAQRRLPGGMHPCRLSGRHDRAERRRLRSTAVESRGDSHPIDPELEPRADVIKRVE